MGAKACYFKCLQTTRTTCLNDNKNNDSSKFIISSFRGTTTTPTTTTTIQLHFIVSLNFCATARLDHTGR